MAWLCVALTGAGGLHAQNSDGLQHQAWGTAEGLPQASVHALAQTPDGFLWAATEDGLARFDGLQFKIFSHEELGRGTSDDLCCLAVDAAGVLWIGSSDGVAALDRSHAVSLPDRVPFTHTPIRQLSVQEGHAVAVTDAGTSVLRADGRAEPAARKPLPSPTLKDRNGNLWIASPDGLKLVHGDSGTAVDLPWLAHQPVLALLQDAEDNIWVGTETTGLHRLRPSMFRTLEGTRGLSATAVAWSTSGVLLGTRGGDLQLLSSNGRTRVLTHFSAGITALAMAGNTAWVGTTDGLYRVDPNAPVTRYTSADGLPDDYIRSLAVASNGEVWAGTPHGLAHLVGSRIEALGSRNGLGGDLIGFLLSAPAQPGRPAGVWVATEAGLSFLEDSHVTQSLNMTGSVVAGMAYDAKGAVWLATQDGWLWRYRSGDLQKVMVLPSGRARRSVQSLFVDRHDTLWLVLRDGVISASLSRLRTCGPQNCRSLTSLVATWGVADGMPSAESLPGAFGPPAQDAVGNLLFATRAGIAVADSAQTAHIVPVPAVIESAALEDQQIEPQRLQSIPYGHTRLTLEYAGLSLGEATRVRYRARLRGFDPDWIETGARHTATYTALAPGSYTFVVQATLEGQPWPETSASLGFRVAPPFYRRWWFLALEGIVILAVVLGLYRLRLATERRRFALIMAERNRLAREVHDTLAQDLVSTGIQLDVVMLGLQRQPQERTLDLLRTLRRRVAQALAEARESIGELRDPNVRLDLASRLLRLADRKSTLRVAVTLEVSGKPPALKPGMEIELLRIAGEAVENALRHARSSSIVVRLEATTEGLLLTVSDNGCGFVPANAETMSGHYGLKGMRERADALGATLSVTSAPGQGTTVRVSLGYAR